MRGFGSGELLGTGGRLRDDGGVDGRPRSSSSALLSPPPPRLEGGGGRRLAGDRPSLSSEFVRPGTGGRARLGSPLPGTGGRGRPDDTEAERPGASGTGGGESSSSSSSRDPLPGRRDGGGGRGLDDEAEVDGFLPENVSSAGLSGEVEGKLPDEATEELPLPAAAARSSS